MPGSDGFSDGIPGIFDKCFRGQKRDPHPRRYVCPHTGKVAVSAGRRVGDVQGR